MICSENAHAHSRTEAEIWVGVCDDTSDVNEATINFQTCKIGGHPVGLYPVSFLVFFMIPLRCSLRSNWWRCSHPRVAYAATAWHSCVRLFLRPCQRLSCLIFHCAGLRSAWWLCLSPDSVCVCVHVTLVLGQSRQVRFVLCLLTCFPKRLRSWACLRGQALDPSYAPAPQSKSASTATPAPKAQPSMKWDTDSPGWGASDWSEPSGEAQVILDDGDLDAQLEAMLQVHASKPTGSKDPPSAPASTKTAKKPQKKPAKSKPAATTAPIIEPTFIPRYLSLIEVCVRPSFVCYI